MKLRWFRRPPPAVAPPPVGPQARLEAGGTEIFLGGEPYVVTLRGVHASFRPRTYLEIGTLHGATLKLAHCASIAVDPEFKLEGDVEGDKPLCLLEQTTSDDFFATRDPKALLGRPIDLAFIDGMHHFEIALRDFFNCERASHRGSMILLHDLCPRDAHMTRRHEQLHVQRPTNYKDHWTGDAWKLLPILREHRPDLTVTCLDAISTGLVAVTGLDPASTVLPERHDAIVEQWMPVALEDWGVSRLFELCAFQSAEAWREGLAPVA
ncbi:MAG: class I SAM-dependent methyltransferase [Pseudomonadota bacterium]|nr:class I SAM-dependent methyltransferase [Pseudomonadota bacterium]